VTAAAIREMPSQQLLVIQSALTSLVKTHNYSYRQAMWLEVAELPEGIEVRLTIEGGRYMRFVRTISSAELLQAHPTVWAHTHGQQWIDEARTRGSRTQQTKLDGSMPPLKPRPPKPREPVTLWDRLDPDANEDQCLDAIGARYIEALKRYRSAFQTEVRQLAKEYAKIIDAKPRDCADLLEDYAVHTNGRGRRSYAEWHQEYIRMFRGTRVSRPIESMNTSRKSADR
jgi:hypothetical protein